MSDFAKEKIAFAVGLLAVLFTITPLLEPFGSVGYQVFGVAFTLQRLYYFLSAVLALAVYAYSIQFLTERDLRYPAILGNVLYAVAIVAPALYVLLLGVLSAVDAASGIFQSQEVQNMLTHVVSALAGAAAAQLTFLLQRLIGRKEKKSVVEQLEREEMQFLRRAEELQNAGHHDLAAVEAWKSLEVAARRALLRRNLQPSSRGNPIRDVEKHQLLPKELMLELERLRKIRNMAAHAVEPVSQEQADNAIATTARMLAALSPQADEDSSIAA